MKTNKLNKREKNSIIINFSMFFVLFLIILIYFVIFLLPDINSLEKEKEEVLEQYNLKLDIEKKWINFNEFKNVYTSNKELQTNYLDTLIKSIDEDFYNKNLQNNDNSIDFNKFIENKTIELNSTENIEKIENQKESILKILPKYSEILTNTDEKWYLTDFKFINYIESIIGSFNLTHNNSIGISNIINTDNSIIDKKNTDSWFASNIYYISLNLELEWTKSNILDFLYFVENVWKIEIDNNKLLVNKNYFPLSKNNIKKVLKWDLYTRDYNIFENQIIDIEKITFSEYIDSSNTFRKDLSLFDFLNKTQANELIKINTELNFYVKWIPTNEIKETINIIFRKFNTLKSDINKKLNNKDLRLIDNINLSKYNETIKSLEKEFLEINKDKNKDELLDKIYKRSKDIERVIDQINNNIKEIWIIKK